MTPRFPEHFCPSHICSIVFLRPSLHIFKDVLQARRFTTLPMKELGGGVERENEWDRLVDETAIFQDCFYSPDKTFYLAATPEWGQRRIHTHADRLACTCGHMRFGGEKKLAVTLNCTSPKWIAAVLAPKEETDYTFSNLLLTHRHPGKATQLCQTHITPLSSSQSRRRFTFKHIKVLRAASDRILLESIKQCWCGR